MRWIRLTQQGTDRAIIIRPEDIEFVKLDEDYNFIVYTKSGRSFAIEETSEDLDRVLFEVTDERRTRSDPTSTSR